MKVEDVIVNFVAFMTFSRFGHPGIFFEAIPIAKRACITRNDDKLPHFKVKQLF